MPQASENRNSSVPVLLIQPPFAPLERPSMGLSLLKPGLAELGIAAEILYVNFDFAEEIGLKDYQFAPSLPMQLLTGEWVFSTAAFPDFDCEEEVYYSLLERGWPWIVETLRRLRGLAPDFIKRQAEKIVARGPKIVGCSSVFAQHCSSLALLRAVKEADPSIVTVIGGSNCEGSMGEVTKRSFPWVDYVVAGEADFTFPALCGQLLADAAPTRLPGVLSSERTSAVGRGQVLELDRTQVPDFGDYFARLERCPDKSLIRATLMVETSRGCWWGAKHHCTFCGLNGQSMSFRSKSPERVLDELESLSQTYSLNNFEAVDNILDMGYLESVFPAIIERGVRYQIFYETKVNLRHKQLECMAQAGVRSLQPGIESLDDRVLALMDKGTTGLQNLQMLKWAREFGIYIVWNVLYGFPGEEDSWYYEMAESVDRLVHLQAPVRMARVRYDRYSPYHYDSDKYGVKLNPSRCYSLVYPLEEEDIEDLAVFFEDAPGSCRGRSGPGVAELGRKINFWDETFRCKNPILSVEDNGECLTIIDTRPCAVEFSYQMGEPARSLYLQCDRVCSRRKLERSGASDHQLSIEEVGAIIDDWEHRQLILEKNGRVLALAVRGELPTLNFAQCGLGGVLVETK